MSMLALSGPDGVRLEVQEPTNEHKQNDPHGEQLAQGGKAIIQTRNEEKKAREKRRLRIRRNQGKERRESEMGGHGRR